ncbi:hypothetical protein GGR88_001277 [Sphingomonas jejuensis]|uniref:DUF1289 domain-containing protein n=1 Tax=Sphingomonas jejuensis TaxID=904715 RepID=A0ABX0XKX8_9SPHN|nr:DUF1289 domain-containing protein [Sphingomonas jejuensis]NJC33803.1 hypothetical protein [Sphingomonas jejuensis]
MSASPDRRLRTPCIGQCGLDRRGYCRGCRRTGDEIAEWPRADEARRREILARLDRRESPLGRLIARVRGG